MPSALFSLETHRFAEHPGANGKGYARLKSWQSKGTRPPNATPPKK